MVFIAWDSYYVYLNVVAPVLRLSSHCKYYLLFNMLLEVCRRQQNRSTPRRHTATNTHSHTIPHTFATRQYCLSLYVFHVLIVVAAAVFVVENTTASDAFLLLLWFASIKFYTTCTITRKTNNKSQILFFKFTPQNFFECVVVPKIIFFWREIFPSEFFFLFLSIWLPEICYEKERM